MSTITLYSTGCPNCLVVERQLAASGVQYEKCIDTNIMIALGLKNVPVLEVDGKMMPYREAIQWLKAGGNR